MKNNSPKLRRSSPADIQVPDGRVRMLESHHEEGFRMKRGSWPFHKCCWVAMGSGRVESEGNSYLIQKDDFLLLPAGTPHRFVDELKDPLTLVMFCISETYVRFDRNPELFDLWTTLNRTWGSEGSACAKTAFHHTSMIAGFRSALREQSEKSCGWETVLEAEANRLIIRWSRGYLEPRSSHVSSSLQTVQGAMSYVKARPYEDFRIEDLSERCRLSPRRFTDLVKQVTGETFSTFLNQQRVRYACHRLDETKHIIYACHEAGYNDLSYFYRVFKKVTGVTPGQYIQTNR